VYQDNACAAGLDFATRSAEVRQRFAAERASGMPQEYEQHRRPLGQRHQSRARLRYRSLQCINDIAQMRFSHFLGFAESLVGGKSFAGL
jgi:hypothetical protein